MGIPRFFSWLVDKYPNIITPAREEEEEEDDDEPPAVGRGKEGPDGIIYDNLYLDMNDIIHNCFQQGSNKMVFRNIFAYMDRLFRIVRPRRLLYLAVDGVAPLAKMNKQRQGHFKSAKDDRDAEVEASLLTERFRAQGKEVLPREKYKPSDRIFAMPGTEFMEKISGALEFYVRSRLNTDPGWKDIKVILSDANVPGEGEHKIMSFIRAQRSMESYDPNTRHCLYGHDADLIMLALASHEVHISVLRQNPHLTEASSKGKLPKKPHQFLNIWVLREYLELEMKIPDCKHDIERLIDDFILICFLTGNDFIPRIPSLEIHEFAVDLLIEVYKTTFNKMGGYIVNTEKVKDEHAAYLEVSRLEKFFHALSLCEEKIFLKRYELREKLLCKIQRQAAENEWNERYSDNVEESPDGRDPMSKSFLTQGSNSTCSSDKSDVRENTIELWKNVDDIINNKDDLFKNGACRHDRIRLGSPGWKSRFYREKFDAETSNEVGRLQTEMVQKYLEGLCWVLQCYFSDVPSWTWHYPFNYAPFASDLKCLSQFKTSFTMDKPLRPFDQLMAALPPERHVSCGLPKCYSKLIGCEESTIQLFYPSELEIDTDGKRFLSQGVVKLPFIDGKLLLSATKTVEKDLTVHEMRRNAIRQERIFLRNANELANNAAFVPMSDHPQEKLPISTSEIGGWLSPDDDGLSNGLCRKLTNDLPDITVSAMFFNPEAVKPISRLLDNVRVPDKTVTEDDIPKRPMWHTYPGPWPPRVTCRPRPETLWKASSPATPREEFKNAGTGWIGRGGASAAAAAAKTQQIGSIGRSSYGHGRGDTETQQQRSGGSGSYGTVFHGADTAQSRGSRFDGGGAYSFRPGGAWAGSGSGGGATQRQQTAWGPWARGGGGGSGPWARGGGGGSGPRHHAL